MNEETAWERAASAQGTTESERALTKLAKQAFLSLWSYPNVYTDVGRAGPGDGKELCDLLVVFGNDVLLFSDKDCESRLERKSRWLGHAGTRRPLKSQPSSLRAQSGCFGTFPDASSSTRRAGRRCPSRCQTRA